MNLNNLHEIFRKYIEKFEYINTVHEEIYKWKIAEEFQSFDLNAEDFESEMKRLLKISENLIDNGYSMPFTGLAEYAKQEPETVRKIFKDLYNNDGTDLKDKQNRIDTFLASCEKLRKKYAPDSHLYVNNQRSAMQFLFLRYPDNNYMYKATQAKSFADCVEFYDDWGPMNDFKIEVFYRMCDMLVEEIKKYPALIETHMSRYENCDTKLHPDKNLHILAFDIIYSSQVYDFYNGMSILPITAQARKLHEERVLKAEKYHDELNIAKHNFKCLQEAKEYLKKTFPVGTEIKHKFFKSGEIVDIEENGFITVKFGNTVKKLSLITLVVSNLLIIDEESIKQKLDEFKPLLIKEKSIPFLLTIAEENFEPYEEYIQ